MEAYFISCKLFLMLTNRYKIPKIGVVRPLSISYVSDERELDCEMQDYENAFYTNLRPKGNIYCKC